MTYNREPLSHEEFEDMLLNWGKDYQNGHISLDEYKANLAKTSLTPVDIQYEIDKYPRS